MKKIKFWELMQTIHFETREMVKAIIIVGIACLLTTVIKYK